MEANASPICIRDMLAHALQFNLEYARRLVADLDPNQMIAIPGPGHENHPAFTIGHLVTALDNMAQDLGFASDLIAGWEELFLRRGPSDRRTPTNQSIYPTRDQLIEELTRHTNRVIEAFESTDLSWFASKSEQWKLSSYLPNNIDLMVFMSGAHNALHLGQLASWRRAMNLPPALAQM